MDVSLNWAADAEPWNSYTLEDGTKVKVRLILTRVVRTGRLMSNDMPEYQFGFQQVMEATPSDLAIQTVREGAQKPGQFIGLNRKDGE